jgi:hypothetical protein
MGSCLNVMNIVYVGICTDKDISFFEFCSNVREIETMEWRFF